MNTKAVIDIVFNKNKRIMIIDDDKDITNLFATFLEYNGYIIDAYTNRSEAINNFKKNSQYDILHYLINEYLTAKLKHCKKKYVN